MIENIGDKIKELRKVRFLSQEKLAQLANLRKDTIYKIEKGKTFPRWDTLIKILEVLKFDLVDLSEKKESSVKESFLSEPAKDVLKWWEEMNPKTRHLIYLISQDIEEILYKKKPLKKHRERGIVSYGKKSRQIKGG